MNAEIIAIGSEMLTPHRSDTNSLFLTERLNELGVDVVYKTVVGDDRNRLTETIALAWRRSDIVLTIGGLGPTEDDLTRDAASAALGLSVQHDNAVAEGIEARFRSRSLRMPQINLRQAMVIEGATVLQNTRGTAPGQWLHRNGKVLILLPGPPRELYPMFEACLPLLKEVVPPASIRTRMLRIAGMSESAVEEIAAPIYTRFTNPVTTILASPGEVQLHFKSIARNDEDAQRALTELVPQIEKALGESIYSDDGRSLEEVVGEALRKSGASVSTAESCTGGMLAQRITAVSGSSEYFLGSVVCYSNQSKEDWVDVPHDLLVAHGAVSSEVARALAEGIRRRARTTYGIGVTGIAGPGGGSAEKPVGLVYIALAGPPETCVQEKKYMGEREIIRWQTTQTALDLLRRSLTASAARGNAR